MYEVSDCMDASEGSWRANLLEMPIGLVAERMWVVGNMGATEAADSDAVLRIFFFGARADLGESAPLIALLETGLSAGARVGNMSLAISRTRTA